MTEDDRRKQERDAADIISALAAFARGERSLFIGGLVVQMQKPPKGDQ